MISKILKSAGVMENVLEYNERKVANGEADRMLIENFSYNYDVMPEKDIPLNIRREFLIRERLNVRTKNVSFHLTFDPSEFDEALDDEGAKALACEVMERMGYADQPWVLYRHRDIDRIHYHISSTTIKADGTRVNGSNEKYRLNQVLHELAPKYKFWVGNPPRSIKAKRMVETGKTTYFNQGADTGAALRRAVEDCLNYRFTSEAQWRSVCEAHGLETYKYVGADGNYKYSFRGLGNDGKPCTNIVDGDALSDGLTKRVESLCDANALKPDTPERKAALKDTAKTVARCLDAAKSEKHFSTLCAREGLSVQLFRSEGDGTVYGATVVDHVNKDVFKASDLSRSLTSALKAADAGWAADAKRRAEEREERRRKRNTADEKFYDRLKTSPNYGGRPKKRSTDSRAARAAARAVLTAVAGTFSDGMKSNKKKKK